MILQQVDQLEGLLASLQGGPGEFKIERQTLAIGATKMIREVAIENLTAVLAKGLANFGKAILAGFAERGSTIETGFAELANRRIDEIEN
jgi:hypothetical protein